MKNWDFDSLRTARPLQPSRRRSLNGGSPVRLVLGLAAIALGAVFFLDNLYWIDAKPVLRYWPAALVLALGAASLYQARRFTLGVLMVFAGRSRKYGIFELSLGQCLENRHYWGGEVYTVLLALLHARGRDDPQLAVQV